MISALHFRDPASVFNFLKNGARSRGAAANDGAAHQAENDPSAPPSAAATLHEVQALKLAMRQIERIDTLLDPIE